ncbi:MAG TPA: hypothetical protein VJX10_16000 [Pseudonocardiaceae bacterium]|nr:hypothetical protein [Pseudonocardiaceae bacterium]
MRAFFDPRPARWRTVIIIGIVLAYADGYLLVALTGAVGAIQRTNHPFGAWLEESAVLVPVMILAELLALRLVRRRTGPALRSGKAVLGAGAAIAVACSLVGFVGIGASTAYDYHLQTQLIVFEESIDNVNGVPLVPAGSTVARGNCNSMICNQERFSLATDLRGVAISAPILVVGNIVLLALLLAYFGGRLGVPERRKTKPAAATAIAPTIVTTTTVIPDSSGEKV